MGKGKQKLNPYMIFINEQVGIYCMIKLTIKFLVFSSKRKECSLIGLESLIQNW